jgi:hypothetical protein
MGMEDVRPQRRMVFQAIQTRTIQFGSTVPIVSIDVLKLKNPALSFDVWAQSLTPASRLASVGG